MSIDLQYIFDAVPGLFLAVAPDSPRFTILAATDAYLHATKTQRSQIIGQALFDVFPDNPDTPEVTATRNTRESLERAIQQRVPDTMAVQRHDIRRAMGGGFEERYWSPVNTPVLDKTGKVVYLIHHVEDVTVNERLKQKGDAQQVLTDNLLRDITERKRAEEVLRQQTETALRLSEQEFRSLAEAMPQIVWATLPDGRNIYFNQQWVDYTGMTMEESYGYGWTTPFHPEEKQRAWDAWQRATQHNERYSLECRLRRADGVYRWWLVRGEPMRDENGEIKKWFGTCTDIEELKRSEAMLHEANNLLEQRVDERTKALQESEEQFRVLIQNLQSAVALVNEHGVFTIVNQAFLRIFELNDDSSVKNVNDRDWSQWQVFDEQGRLLGLDEHPVRKAALQGRTVRDQLIAVKAPANPQIKWLLVSAEPFLDSQGHIYRLICTYHDITERKLGEEAVRRSQKIFHELIERSPFGTYVIDSQFRIAIMNTSSQAGAFCNVQPLIGRDFAEAMHTLWPDEVAEEIIGHFRNTLDTGNPYYSRDFINPRNDVEIVEAYEWELHRIALPDGQNGVICYYYDSTKLRQAEAAVRESERRLVGVLESMPDAFVSFDRNLRYTYVNRNAERLQATRREELLGKDVREVYPDPESYKTISLYDQVMAEGVPVTITSYHAGFDLWVEVQAFSTPDGISVFYKDVSDKIKAEAAMRESEERLRLLGDNLPESAVYQYTHEADGTPRFIYFSAGIERLNGISVAAALADAGVLHRQILPEYFERLVATEAECIRELSDFDMEVPMSRPDGAVRWMRLHSRPRRMPGGSVVWDGVQIDITERKRAEEHLQKDADRLAAVLEAQRKIGGAKLDYAPFLQFVLDRVSHLTGADGACLEIAEAGEMVYEAATGLAAGFVGLRLKAEGSMSGLCLASDELKRADDTETDPRVDREACQRIGFRSMIVIPLRYDQHSFGVLKVMSRRVSAFDADTEQKLRMMAGFLGVTVARKRADDLLKASLAEKEVMLKEIHHRVKNNLQIISSLVSMQVDTLTDERIRKELDDVRDRIRSMALVHEKLYQTDSLAQIDFADYAATMLRVLWNSHGALASKVRLNLMANPVMLPIETALPCGLILNELTGNTLKHAFPNGSDGEVTVGLEHDAAAKAVCLWVRDNGIGLSPDLDWRQSSSLGLRLVQLLAGQLRGTVESGTGPGAEFRVTFPLKGVQA